jgi:hypothetical protein
MMATPENKPDTPVTESLEDLQKRYWEWHADRVAEDRAETKWCPAEFDRLNTQRP